MPNSVPILNYKGLVHSLSLNSATNQVHLKEFENQLEWLAENHYSTITLDDLVLSWKEGTVLSKKVIISFEETSYFIYKWIAPLMYKYNFFGTLFLSGDSILKSEMERKNIKDTISIYPDRPLSWTELRELTQLGWEIAGKNHHCGKHEHRNRKEILEEMSKCREILYDHVDFKINHYLYPAGKSFENYGISLRELGFISGISDRIGKANKSYSKWNIPRISVKTSLPLVDFQKKVETGYQGKWEKFSSRFIELTWGGNRFTERKDYLMEEDKPEIFQIHPFVWDKELNDFKSNTSK